MKKSTLLRANHSIKFPQKTLDQEKGSFPDRFEFHSDILHKRKYRHDIEILRFHGVNHFQSYWLTSIRLGRCRSPFLAFSQDQKYL